MQWTASQTPDLLAELAPRFAEARWPEIPADFARLGPQRPMRQVLVGPSDAAGGTIVVKWSRPVTLTDRVVRSWRGGKGPREGRLLLALAEANIAVPVALAFTDEGTDLLVTRLVEDLHQLPPGPDAPPALVEAVARLLGRAWGAGLRHRDLHLGNVALSGGRPLLIDVGGARLARGGSPARALGRALVALGGALTRTQRLRALGAWAGEVEGDVARERRHSLARRADAEARRVARRYRRGRDRRATRTGRHFEVFGWEGGVSGVRRTSVDETAARDAAVWLNGLPAGAEVLKGDGRVFRARLGSDGRPVVVKRYAAALPGRLPRPVRAFRAGVHLEHRLVGVPAPLFALVAPTGEGILVSAWVDAPDLHVFTKGGRGGTFATLPAARQRETCEQLGRFLRHLHEADLYHRDLKAPNLLVAADDGAGARFLVTDLEGARRARGAVGWERRARDLARLDASLDASDGARTRVLAAYWRVPPLPPVAKRHFTARVALHVARKRGPSGRPR